MISTPKTGRASVTPSRDAMTHSPAADPAAIEQTMLEEPNILTLPVELQQTIMDYVSFDELYFNGVTRSVLTGRQLTSYNDLKSICLVCKHFHKIATPYLYRKMEVTGEYLDSDQFIATITKTHPGLPSVKTVRVVRPFPRLKIAQQLAEKSITALCRLHATIPKHSLTCFEYAYPEMYACRKTYMIANRSPGWQSQWSITRISNFFLVSTTTNPK